MLEAVLASMPGKLAAGAWGVRGLFTVSGSPILEAQRKVVELYSPSRVHKERWARSGEFPSLTTGSTLLTPSPTGRAGGATSCGPRTGSGAGAASGRSAHGW